MGSADAEPLHMTYRDGTGFRVDNVNNILPWKYEKQNKETIKGIRSQRLYDITELITW